MLCLGSHLGVPAGAVASVEPHFSKLAAAGAVAILEPTVRHGSLRDVGARLQHPPRPDYYRHLDERGSSPHPSTSCVVVPFLGTAVLAIQEVPSRQPI